MADTSYILNQKLPVEIIVGTTNLKNLIVNGDFSNGVFHWVGSNATLRNVDGKASMLATAKNGLVNNQFMRRISGHKYYMRANVKATSDRVSIHSNGAPVVGARHSGTGNSEILVSIFTAPSTIENWIVGIVDERDSGWNDIEFDNFMVVDLTETYGSGKEPTITEMDNILSSSPNKWFSDTLSLTQKANLPNANQVESLINRNSKVLETTHHAGTNQNSDGPEVTVTGFNTVLFSVEGAFKANLHFECLYDDNRNWRKLNVIDISTGQPVQKLVANQTETGLYRADVTGLKKIRVRVARYHSGSITVQSRCTVQPTSDSARVQLSGNVVPTNPIYTFDIATRKAYPKNYARPYLENKAFGVRGYDKATNVLYGISTSDGKRLLSSPDNLQTIETGFQFDYNIQKVVISDTHILVSVFDEPNKGLGKVYKTAKQNGVKGPFVEVEGLNLSNFVYVTPFGMQVYYDYPDSTGRALRNYVLISQYGSKTAEKQANEVYFSKDGGETFTKIFTGVSAAESHVHTVKYDQYMDRIWVSNGDYGARTISFSDDHGSTWETAVVDFWPTIIIPTPKYVLFGADSLPMGLHRWNRSREEYERSIEGGKISRAFEPNFFPVRANTQGDVHFAADYAQEDDWTFYIPFMGAGSSGMKSFIIGTGDGGETAHVIWMDRTDKGSGFGVGIFGTLPDGSIISHYFDTKRVNTEPVFRIPKIEWKEY